MASIGNVLEFVTVGRMTGFTQELLNVWHYRVSDVTGGTTLDGDAQAIANDYAAEWLSTISPGLSTAFSFIGIRMTNLSDPDEFAEATFTTPVVGATGGDYLPPFYTWGIELKRASRSTRNGRKALSGVAESNVSSGAPTSAAVTFFNSVAINAATPLLLDFGSPLKTLDLVPIIVRRGAGFSVLATNEISNGVFKGLTTQNSRKTGRGS